MASDAPAALSSLYEQVTRCGKCGFCQPGCPVYRTTHREAHVARGKNALVRNVIEGDTVLDADLRDAFDNCLLCRACTAACFADLPTDRLVVTFRQTYARRFGRPLVQRLIFRRLLPRRRRMRAVMRLLWSARRSGLEAWAVRRGLVDMVNPKLSKALTLSEGVPGAFLRERLGVGTPGVAGDTSGPRVGYWVGCGYEYMLPATGEAAVRVLRESGVEVEILPNVCCGLPVYGYGDLDGARILARANLEAIGDVGRLDAVVSDCASCSGHLKEYPELLKGDERAPDAALLAAKVRSLSEFLAAADPPRASRAGASAPATRPVTVTFHEPCHLGARYQGVVRQPRDLLRSLPGVEFREMRDADACCGAAGSYSVMNPDISRAVLQRKMENVAATGAEILVTECPSCMLQLAAGARLAGSSVRVVGLADLLCELGGTPKPERPSLERR